MKKTLSAFLAALLTFSAFEIAVAPANAQTTSSIQRGPSGLPLPRFVSLKAGQVNMRVGPGKQYAIAWRYMKAGLPLEIVQEYDNWRRVRDAEGDMGWVHSSLLSGTRTAIATPWRQADGNETTVALFKTNEPGADAIAHLKPGVVGKISKCDGAWCEFEVTDDKRVLRGYAVQADLWGAYPQETIE